jgi:hypothetical protein
MIKEVEPNDDFIDNDVVVPPEVVLQDALDANLDKVIVIGEKYGEEMIWSSHG